MKKFSSSTKLTPKCEANNSDKIKHSKTAYIPRGPLFIEQKSTNIKYIWIVPVLYYSHKLYWILKTNFRHKNIWDG